MRGIRTMPDCTPHRLTANVGVYWVTERMLPQAVSVSRFPNYAYVLLVQGSGCADLMSSSLGAANNPNSNEFLLTETNISLTGGSLGSWIDEERSKLR